MLKIIMTILLGIILTSCAATKKVNTFKGDLPYVEGTPTSELLEKIPDIHNQAILDATQQLYDLAKDPVLFRRRGANADQVFDSLYNDAIRNILGGGTFRIGVSMAGGGSTTGTSSLGTSQGASGLLPNKSQAKKIIN